MRETIFDLLKKNYNFRNEVNKIIYLINNDFDKFMGQYDGYPKFKRANIVDFVDEYRLRSWKYRGTEISVEGLFKKANLYNSKSDLDIELNEFLLYLELFLNILFLYIGNDDIEENEYEYVIFSNINTLLNNINYKFINLDEENIKIIVIEDRENVLAVVEKIYDDNISIDIIRYNHFQLKGNIYEKRKILTQIYKEYEKRKNILSGNGFNAFKSDLSGLFNNIGIRHDEASDRIITERVQNMSDEELEMWCDRTYDMFLTAVLLCDYIDIKPEIKALNDKSSKE